MSVDNSRTSWPTYQRHPMGLRQWLRRRAIRRKVDVGGLGRRSGPAVPGVRCHQGTCTGQEFHRKTCLNIIIITIIITTTFNQESGQCLLCCHHGRAIAGIHSVHVMNTARRQVTANL